MRFDDSLNTVLAADTTTQFGAQSAWRQLVDLLARGRAGDDDRAIARLVELRATVPAPVRAATARALAWGEPPASLVTFFAQDELAIAAPVVRTATLGSEAWLRLLPRLTPALREALRQRRDLPADVVRGLASFGTTDFVLSHDGPPAAAEPPAFADAAEPAAAADPPGQSRMAEPTVDADPPAAPATPLPPPAQAPLAPTPFVALGDVARGLPVVAEALARAAEPAPRFEIADLVARIDAHRRDRVAPPAAPAPPPSSDSFRFETDASGTIRWVEGVPRGPLVGLSLARPGRQGGAEIDAVSSGAIRHRGAFRDARVEIGGASPVAGSWRLAAEPRFDRATGRFTGMSGVARRARREEMAAPGAPASDLLRQLVHELRTPTNAIAGFAELIGSALLGPVPPVYGDRARLIQRQAGDLLAAIDDLDTAARIEGHALDLRPGPVDLAALLTRIAADLAPLAAERGASLTVEGGEPAIVQGDDRAVERLVTRLLATLVALAHPGERLRVQLATKTRMVRLAVTRPRALADRAEAALLSLDGEPDRDEAPLLGTGFTLRLLRNLAAELGGRLAIEPDRLTLRLPIAFAAEVEHAAAQ